MCIYEVLIRSLPMIVEVIQGLSVTSWHNLKIGIISVCYWRFGEDCTSFFICCHTFPSMQAPERNSHQLPQHLGCLSRWWSQAGASRGNPLLFVNIFKLNWSALNHALEEPAPLPTWKRISGPKLVCRVHRVPMLFLPPCRTYSMVGVGI